MDAEVAERFKEMKQYVSDHYAGKADIALLREEIADQFGRVYVKFAEVEGSLDAKMSRLESSMIKWFVATAFALVSTTFVIARFV